MAYARSIATLLLVASGLSACSIKHADLDPVPVMAEPEPVVVPPPEPQEVAPAVARTGAAAVYEFDYLPTGGSPDRVVRRLPSIGWFYSPNTLAGIPADFSVFRQATEGYLLRGTTADGTGEVIIVDNGAQLTRTGTTIVPATGSATYSGTYAGIVVQGIRDMAPETVSGIASIDVDFAEFDVSGQITDRFYDGATAAEDVALNISELTDGAFTGTTSGGDLNSGGLVAADGAYTGLIVGANSENIIGAVTIDHAGGGQSFVEQGGMILSD